MEGDKSKLAGPGSKIDRQTRRQSELQSLAEAYAGQQSLRVKWIDVLGKVKDYFNDQDVWITDFEPVGLYRVGDDKSYESRVKGNFVKTKYGDSSLDDLSKSSGTTVPSKSRGRGKGKTRGGSVPEPPQGAINVIRLTGFWKSESKAVNDIVEKIRADQDKDEAIFVLKKNPADPKSADLADEEILPLLKSSITDENQLAEQFVMILPLKEPISIK